MRRGRPPIGSATRRRPSCVHKPIERRTRERHKCAEHHSATRRFTYAPAAKQTTAHCNSSSMSLNRSDSRQQKGRDMGGKGIARRSALALGLILALGTLEGRAQQTDALVTLTYAEQGWSAADRETFYTTSQGSHLIPYAWFKALKRTDVDESFAADKLQRYGFLPHDVSPANPEGLPIGFVIDGPAASGQLGLTCAACHTGQLEYTQGGVVHALRIDGGPAKTDAQQFLADLLAASRATSGRPRPVRRFRQGGSRPRRQCGEGGASEGRAWQVGRAIRGIHGRKPTRGEPMGTRPPRRVRDDLQSHRRARSRHSRQLQGCRRAGPLSVPMERLAAGSHPMERRRSERTLHPGSRTQHRRSPRSVRRFRPSPLAHAAACAGEHLFQGQLHRFCWTADAGRKDRRAASAALAARNIRTGRVLGREGQAVVRRQLRRLSRGAAFARFAGTLAHPGPRGRHRPEDA